MENETITVSILDRRYKLRAGGKKAESLQQAAEMVDTIANKYGRMYGYHDYQDLLAMVALTQMERLLAIDSLLVEE